VEIIKVEITRVENKGRLLAFCTCETDIMKIWDIKILSQGEGVIVSLPTKRKERAGKVEFHPYMRFNPTEWEKLSAAIIKEYESGK